MSNPTTPPDGYSTAKKRALLAQLLQEKASSKFFPLSPAQERLWFLDRWQPHSAVYNICRGLRLRGMLDIQALHQSFSAVVARHEALRITFSNVNGQPRQLIPSPSEIDLPLIDMDREERTVDQIITAETQRPFDLAAGPLLRATLLRLSVEEHILLLVIHHIAADGWSMKIFFREIAHFYRSYAAKKSTSLPDLPIQYVDYAVWQREWLRSEASASHLSYWKRQLAAPRPILNLPTDRPRPATRTYYGARYTLALPTGLCAQLKAFSHDEGVTLFMSLLAAFNVLLYRYTDQTDILVGTSIANRNRREVEGLIGFFANTLVLRSNLSRKPTFRALLKRVREMTMAAYAHQALPFERLVAELQPERDPSRSPLFQVMFVFQPDPTPALNLPQIEVEPLAVDNGTAKFDLTVYVNETEAGLQTDFEYAMDIFDEATIARMADHWERLLSAAVADPEQSIATLPLLTPAEQQQMPVAWKKRPLDYPEDLSIHQIFEAQAARTPEAIAVSFEGTSLTYAQLNQRANQLAAHLRSLNVGPNVPVGIYMERSLEMVVGLLAILKAGGAYVPFDPAYPQERLAFMAQDARLPLLLTQQHLVDSLPPQEAEVVCIDTDWPTIVQQSQENLPGLTALHHLAYVIYTSGSTGKAKGVLVTHANVVRLFTATEAWYHFDQDDVWTLFHAYTFDFSVWEIWGALFYGGRLVIVPYWISRSPQDFYRLLAAERVTVLNQTPSAFRQLIQAEETLGVSPDLALRYIIFGGEALDMQSLQPWFDRHGDQKPQLVNMYGITETTVHVTYRPLSATDLSAGSVIGGPIPDLQLYILDQDKQLVPIGVIGEIYVGGAGVSRGYLNRPKLTAERFIPDPFSDDPRTRLYRSGDLGRYLPNGDIEYLGRLDHQVKIRGFRIELGEIETKLRQHMAINQAVVIAREITPGDQRLVAYYTASETLPTSELRRFLSQSLPDYMLPGAFVHLENMPLTLNKKIDRQALPAPAFSQTSENYVPPSTPTEKTLAEIWTTLLNLEHVGIQDNFFELGGHSLLATQLISRVYKRFNIALPLQALFRAPTISGLIETLIAYEKVPGQIEKTAELYLKLNNMSPDQIRTLLEAKKPSYGEKKV